MPNTTESRHQAELDAAATHSRSPPVSHEGGEGVEEQRAARGGEKKGAPSPYIAARGFTRAHLPARAKSSPSRASLREPPHRPPKSPACTARSRAPRKRTLATFPGSQAQAGFLAVFSQTIKRANLANAPTCSPRARSGYWPPSQTRPKRPDQFIDTMKKYYTMF
jgi:hypothetical protein